MSDFIVRSEKLDVDDVVESVDHPVSAATRDEALVIAATAYPDYTRHAVIREAPFAV